MKPHEEIAEDTGIKLGTLREYLKQLEDEGFIERRQARYNRKSANGTYYVTMGGYINVTDTFLKLINVTSKASVDNNTNDSNVAAPENPPAIDKGDANSSNSDNNQIIETPKTRESYIRDLRTSFNNNITFKNLIHSVDKATLDALLKQYELITRYFDTEIKEEIPEEVKKLVLGTFFNLTFEHKKRFSEPQQVAAEYLFSLINTEFCLPEVGDFKHRNCILAKVIRKNNWRTPKGFFKHFYQGQQFKDKKERRERLLAEEKKRALNSQYTLVPQQTNEQLKRIEADILAQVALIDALQSRLHAESREDAFASIRNEIRAAKEGLSALWDEQATVEYEIQEHARLCA